MARDWNQVQRSYYDHSVGEYEEIGARRARGYVRKVRILHRALADVQGSVLEVGAGSGLVTQLLAPRLSVERYTALDLSPSMLDKARERCPDPRIEYMVGDATRTGIEDQRFDAVLGVDILHHIERPVEALAEWLRVVRPGGRLVVLEANAYNLANRAYLGMEFELRVFLNTDENLATWTRQAGWEGVGVEPAPAYTPSGPPRLSGVLDAVDALAVRVPWFRRMTALWLVTARKPAR